MEDGNQRESEKWPKQPGIRPRSFFEKMMLDKENVPKQGGVKALIELFAPPTFWI